MRQNSIIIPSHHSPHQQVVINRDLYIKLSEAGQLEAKREDVTWHKNAANIITSRCKVDNQRQRQVLQRPNIYFHGSNHIQFVLDLSKSELLHLWSSENSFLFATLFLGEFTFNCLEFGILFSIQLKLTSKECYAIDCLSRIKATEFTFYPEHTN